jgi:hypothetical protein
MGNFALLNLQLSFLLSHKDKAHLGVIALGARAEQASRRSGGIGLRMDGHFKKTERADSCPGSIERIGES